MRLRFHALPEACIGRQQVAGSLHRTNWFDSIGHKKSLAPMRDSHWFFGLCGDAPQGVLGQGQPGPYGALTSGVAVLFL